MASLSNTCLNLHDQTAGGLLNLLKILESWERKVSNMVYHWAWFLPSHLCWAHHTSSRTAVPRLSSIQRLSAIPTWHKYWSSGSWHFEGFLGTPVLFSSYFSVNVLWALELEYEPSWYPLPKLGRSICSLRNWLLSDLIKATMGKARSHESTTLQKTPDSMTYRKPAPEMRQLWQSRFKRLFSLALVILLLAVQKASGWISMIPLYLRMPYVIWSISFSIYFAVYRGFSVALINMKVLIIRVVNSIISVNLKASTSFGDLLPEESEPDKILDYLRGLVNNLLSTWLEWERFIFAHPLDLSILPKVTPNLVIP